MIFGEKRSRKLFLTLVEEEKFYFRDLT